jgi:hypothetical protein
MKLFIRELALVLMGLLLWACAAVAAYGCSPAISPDECDRELADINAQCAARKAVCSEPGCEDAIEAECAEEIKGACQ